MTEQSSTLSAFRAPWKRRMVGRDPGEEGRTSTPLELLFDLCFVVAVAQAAEQLAHSIETNHVGAGLLGYAMVFVAIWWAWMNFTWFASAYDTDDVPYRLLTLLQMAGALVLAAGVPAAFDGYHFTGLTVGYVIMRVAMVIQWLRAAAEHPAGRATSLRYAGGITIVQVLWVLRLLLPPGLSMIAFGILILAELAVPVYAESRGRGTAWHPEHIAERYGLLTLIVLGEGVLGTTVAIQAGFTESGSGPDLALLGVGGLLLIFGLWWTYFIGGDEGALTSMWVALTWGYGHYLVFAAIGALAAGLEVSAAVLSSNEAHVPAVVAGLTVAVPMAVFLVVIGQLRRLSWPAGTGNHLTIALVVVALLGIGLLTDVLGLGFAVLLMGLAVGIGLARFLTVAGRRARRLE